MKGMIRRATRDSMNLFRASLASFLSIFASYKGRDDFGQIEIEYVAFDCFSETIIKGVNEKLGVVRIVDSGKNLQRGWLALPNNLFYLGLEVVDIFIDGDFAGFQEDDSFDQALD